MNEKKQWWEPEEQETGAWKYTWHCDHLGDAMEVMQRMWEEILRLRKEVNGKSS